jgi:hypothetical protein
MRLVAAVRAGDVSAAIVSSHSASNAGVDCAKLLIDLSYAQFASGNFRPGAELRAASKQYPTEDGDTLAERAIDWVYEDSQGAGADVDVESLLAAAEVNGAQIGRLTFARLLVGIHRSDVAVIERFESPGLALLSQGHRVMLAVEAMSRRRCGLALRLLGDDAGIALPSAGAVRYPHSDATKALALLSFGRLPEALRLKELIAKAPPHPMHAIALGYMAYAKGDVQGAVRHLDDAARMARGPSPLELTLRGQCFAELGEYGLLADFLRLHRPNLPVSQCSARWGKSRKVTPLTTGTFGTSHSQFAGAVAFVQQMNPDAEHIGFMRRSGRLLPVAGAVYHWEVWFTQVAESGADDTPLLLRIASLATRTLQRLLGGSLDAA